MSQQVRFFEKSKSDYSDEAIIITSSQGNEYAPRVLDRSNLTAWMTTGSVDADNTTLEIDFQDTKLIDTIILIKHNFKSYKIEFWDGFGWQPFSTPIDVTNSTEETSFHQFATFETTKLRMTIRGTQVANEEKRLYQFIATEQIGQFKAWPIIKKATTSRNRSKNVMLSGKMSIREQVGAFSCSMSVQILRDDADNTIIEKLHQTNDGFLVWICGGDETQFSSRRIGYRLEDLFLMKCINELTNEFYQGVYPNGLVVKFDLAEVVD